MNQDIYDWVEEINSAVTICDKEGVILYMNRRARETFAKHGSLIGHNLYDCHSEESKKKINHLLITGESNAYTIHKGGIKKMIYQTPWRRDGNIAGLVEFSMVIPEEIPHYIR